MEFIIDAAELSPALRALAPITHALPKGEPEEAESCEIIYGRPTTTGKLLLIAGTDPIEFEPTEADKARVLKSFLSEPGEEASDEEVAEIVEGLNALQSAAQNITQDDFELAQG